MEKKGKIRKVTRVGLYVRGRVYWHPELIHLISKQVEVFYDNDSEAITIATGDGRIFKDVTPVSPSRIRLGWHQSK